MIRSPLMLAPLLLIAADPVAPDPVKLLAGRYSDHFANGLMSGEQYDSDDVVEIVPVDPTHAYVRFELQFYNGHSCSLAGIAKADGDSLVYDDPSANSVGSGQCKLSIAHRGADLAWNDHDGTCASFCGGARWLCPWLARVEEQAPHPLHGETESVLDLSRRADRMAEAIDRMTRRGGAAKAARMTGITPESCRARVVRRTI